MSKKNIKRGVVYKILIVLVFIFIISLFFINYKSLVVGVKLPEATVFTVLPEKVFPGDPIIISVQASSTISKVLFDEKEIKSFIYKNKTLAFVGIPFEEKKIKHDAKVYLSNGLVLEKKIDLNLREKIVKPLGIPEKLGGNTPKAGKALVSNLALDNTDINKNSLITENKVLWSGDFVAPLSEVKITDDYGYNRDTVGYTIVHKGTDFRAPVGTEVKAINSGIVRVAKTYTSYGNAIIIDHGLGVTSLYMHLSELKVKQGDTVTSGQVIGLSGQTGYATAPHLHLSIKIKGISIDPAKFLRFFSVL